MSIQLAVAGRSPIVLDDEYITLGSDPACSVAFPDTADVMPKHAVIQLVSGRWLIEVRQAESIFVGGIEPKKMHWLQTGDVVQLSKSCPTIVFLKTDVDVPPVIKAAPATGSKSTVKAAVPPAPKPATTVAPLAGDDDEPAFRLAEDPDKTSRRAPLMDETKPVAPTAKQSTKAPSSAIIPTMKTKTAPLSSASLPKTKAPSSTTIPTDPPSTVTIKTSKPLTETSIPTKPLTSTSINTTKPLTSSSMKASKPLTSASIKTTGKDSIASGSKSAIRTRSDASVPATGTRLPDSDGEIPVSKSASGEPDMKMPVLKRITSWDQPAAAATEVHGEEWDESLPRRGKKKEDEDIRFIKTVVIRSVIVSVVIIILWHLVREIHRAATRPPIGAPTTFYVVPDTSDPASHAS